jgi:hypothetical protein
MKRNNNIAQVTLEFALAFVIVVILFWAIAQLFFYFNSQMVLREQYYESHPSYGRKKAGNHDVNREVQVDEQELPGLNFWEGY